MLQSQKNKKQLKSSEGGLYHQNEMSIPKEMYLQTDID